MKGGFGRPCLMQWRSIPVHVKRNPRAKRVWIRMRPHLGLEVVLPFRVSVAEVPSILDRHDQWILERHRVLAGRNEAPGQSMLPAVVSLTLPAKSWSVQVQPGEQAVLAMDDRVLRLTCPEDRQNLAVALLQRFLIRVGQDHLVPYCWDVSAQTAIPIVSVQIRNQATRWGSCSVRGVISLNAKLLFLDMTLVRHVVLHELCHVSHHNHGPAFWRHLEKLDPMTSEHDAKLRQAWDLLPAWSRFRLS